MPLGLLAKDSIQDLAALHRESNLYPENDTPSTTGPTKEQPEDAETDESTSTSPPPLDADPTDRPGGKNGSSEVSVSSSREANPQQPPTLQYAGFSQDYYPEDHYTPDFLPHNQRSTGGGGLLWCLFPWLAKSAAPAQSHKVKTQPSTSQTPSALPPAAAAVEEDAESKDNESTNSNILGERLSEKERQAVLARLRLAQPEQESSHEVSERSIAAKGLLNRIPVYDTPPQGETKQGPLKGILKNRSAVKIDEQATKSKEHVGQPHRRSLFPSYETKPRSNSNKSASFAPMARVVTVKSKSEMTDEEKGDIWWRRSDYEDFRKTGRIITRAMLEGGSEIWLTTEDNAKEETTGDIATDATGDKWWHQFGHSRRGLEHVVSMEEGRQRQTNVKTAIRSVLEEHARQKLYKRVDSEKLRIVALQHTTWARDLALASGASDDDAVQSAFAENRRSREFYLLKMSRSSPLSTNTIKKHVPQFMQPAMQGIRSNGANDNRTTLQQRLDANTAAQIQFRRHKIAPDASGEKKQADETKEPVHDRPDGKSKLAQQAAGFAADGEKVNMAAVLSGMGTLQEKQLPTMKVST